MSFQDRDIRAICEDEHKAKQVYGDDVTKYLQTRLADFRAYKSLKDVIVGRLTELTPVPNLSYKIDLCGEHCMVICPNHVKLDYLEDGIVNLSKVSRIQILKIDRLK